MSSSSQSDEMWLKACFLSRLVASSVRVSESAGQVIKDILAGGDLRVVNKSEEGGKSDPQTEADRAAQYCIVQSLQKQFGNKLNIIGEEDVTSVVPQLETAFHPAVLSVDNQCSADLRAIREEEVVVWVDPLDGTTEVARNVTKSFAHLQQVTVLIGIAHKGRAVAGVVHQPYYGEKGEGRTVWAIKDVGVFGLTPSAATEKKVVVTTRSHSSQLVSDALEALREKQLLSEVERVGGAGYKVLRVLEGAAAYVFASGGCKKWDTAAPEAILEAAGGCLTDISGRRIVYDADVQRNNSGGVLATAPWVKHSDYLSSIPQPIKEQLPEILAKK